MRNGQAAPKLVEFAMNRLKGIIRSQRVQEGKRNDEQPASVCLDEVANRDQSSFLFFPGLALVGILHIGIIISHVRDLSRAEALVEKVEEIGVICEPGIFGYRT